jgi:Putative DNA-binding domain
MIPNRLEQVQKDDIETLVANVVREGRTIEYKQQLPGGRDEDKKEFLADVSSFANAAGGDLIYGVEEERDENGKALGTPKEAKGIIGINADQEIQRLENILRSGLEPRIPGIQTRAIDGFTNGPVIVIRVPRSWAAPHMVTFKASPRFYSRTSAGKAPLDVAEIRAAFIQSEALPERIRRFREDRLSRIMAGETPLQLTEEACAVLHILPVSAFQRGDPVDVTPYSAATMHLRPLGASGFNERISLDGCVAYQGVENGDVARNYTQLFRNGVIEAVDTGCERKMVRASFFQPLLKTNSSKPLATT